MKGRLHSSFGADVRSVVVESADSEREREVVGGLLETALGGLEEVKQ